MQPYYTTLFVPLDIGKNVHWCAGYEGYDLKPVVEPFKVRSDRSGFEQVTRIIDGLLSSGQYDRVVLGHEPTGIYHQAWSRALYDHYEAHRTGQARPQPDYQFLNPLLTKRQQEQLARGRKCKTDAADLRAIAFCLRDGQGQAAFLPTDQAVRFQLWGQAYDQTRQALLRQSIQLISQLDRLWPGLVVNVKRFGQMHPDLEAPTPASTVQTSGTPAGPGLIAILPQSPRLPDPGSRRYPGFLLHPYRPLRLSHRSIGLPPAPKCGLASARYCRPSGREESGDFRRLGHITKKGDPGLRDTLYLIGLHTSQHLPAIARAGLIPGMS
jgi:hypothetical protein